MLGGRVFQHTVGIHMGTKCAPFLVNLFLYLYDSGASQETRQVDIVIL